MTLESLIRTTLGLFAAVFVFALLAIIVTRGLGDWESKKKPDLTLYTCVDTYKDKGLEQVQTLCCISEIEKEKCKVKVATIYQSQSVKTT